MEKSFEAIFSLSRMFGGSSYFVICKALRGYYIISILHTPKKISG